MNKKDMFIKEKLQQDKVISDRANSIFENLKGEFIMDNNNEKKVIKISFNKFLAIAASFVLVLFVGTNLYAHSLGKPNIFTAIKNLFNIDKEDYNAAEEDINITVESNGVKLTLKTAAMDDNVLIVKYVAEGEKLSKEFYTYQDFELEMIEYVKMLLTQAEWSLQEDTYKNITGKEVMRALYSIRDRLYEIGLNEEETQELLNLATNVYIEYVALQNSIIQDASGKVFTEEGAKEQVEKAIAMFESKVTSKYEIITSEDKLSGYKIEAIAQSIEKEENKYVIHAIYNVDTLVDILDKFNLKININKIGTIEGNWNYSVELNKSNLNKRVETIDFYNEYEVVIDSQEAEPAEDFNLKVDLKQLSISDFSSVLNIQTIKEQYYNKIDYTNLEKNIFPITFVVLDETGKVIGTSCQTREDAINAYPIVDRIILKDVDYNTEKITIKMYSNNDNTLIETLEVNLKDAKKFMDTSLSNNFYNPEVGGICFNYPSDWVRANNIQDIGTGRVLSPENLDGKRAFFEASFYRNEEKLTAEEAFKRVLEHHSLAKIEEKGKTIIGINGLTADYFIETHDGEKWKVIIVVVDDTVYHITFCGDEKLYAKYEAVFEKILKTVTFSKVTLWEEMEEQENLSDESEDNTNVEENNQTVLYGDVNCDGKVTEEDATYLLRYTLNPDKYPLTDEGKMNADVNLDGIINSNDAIVIQNYVQKKEGYETLPYTSSETVLHGDVNCDGKVDEDDVEYLKKYLAKWEGYELTDAGKANADVNQDGNVNLKDRTILTRHVADWEGYEMLPYITVTDVENSNDDIYKELTSNLSQNKMFGLININKNTDGTYTLYGGIYEIIDSFSAKLSNEGYIKVVVQGDTKYVDYYGNETTIKEVYNGGFPREDNELSSKIYANSTWLLKFEFSNAKCTLIKETNLAT